MDIGGTTVIGKSFIRCPYRLSLSDPARRYSITASGLLLSDSIHNSTARTYLELHLPNITTFRIEVLLSLDHLPQPLF